MAKPPRSPFARLARLGSLTSRVTGSYVGQRLMGAFSDKEKREKALEKLHLQNAQRMVETMGQLKGAAMKVGQTFAQVAESMGLPEEVAGVLGKLHDDVEPIDFATIKEDIESSLEAPLEELFSHFEEEPIGTASLGQAHVARMPDGTEVVVKVLHRGIDASVRSDIAALKTILLGSRLLRRPREEMDAIFSEVQERLEEELDYLREAANIEAFARAFEGDDRVRIPRTFPSHSSERVLTMHRLPGRPIDEFIQDADPVARQRASETLTEVFYRQLFRLRMLHADPHPGNYLFEDDGTVGLLDFGCVKRFDVYWMGGYARAALGAIEEDREACMAACRELDVWTGETPEAGSRLWRFCDALIHPLRLERWHLGGPQDDVLEVMRRRTQALIRFPEIRAPGELVYLNRSLAGIYTLGQKLGGELPLGDLAQPHIRYAIDLAAGRIRE